MNIVFALHRFLMATTSPTNKNKNKKNWIGTRTAQAKHYADERKKINKSINFHGCRGIWRAIGAKKIGTLKWIFHFDINIYLIPLLFALLARHAGGAGRGGGGVSRRIFEFCHPGILHIFISREFNEKCVEGWKNRTETVCEILKENESLAI